MNSIYDNRITSTTDVFSHTLAYEYELTSTVNQKRLKFDGAMYAVYNFDDADRLTNIVDSNDSTQINFGYDNADRLISKTLPNNITTTYEYDGMSRLKRLKDVSMTATLFDRQYAYNPASQINQIVEPTNTRSFGYDSIDRLKTVTASNNQNENYNYDTVGNRTSSHLSTSYTYQTGQFNRLASTATANYNYDANGNLVTKGEGKNFWRFTWDYENRLTSASTRKETVRYKYDALGRRVQRYFRGGKENTKFIYDGQDVLVDDNNGVLTKYQNGLGIDDKLKISLNGTAKYFLADHLGSTNGLADSSGNLTEQTAYDSFGTATTNLSTRYQFTGREFDNFTGLHYYRARFYDSQIGRFIAEDPIGFAGGDVNLYGYVLNNPLHFIDPFGLNPIKLPGHPSQLPDGWTPDSSHKNPNGSRWISPTGNEKLEFEPGRPGKPGWKGKDHWHKWVPDPSRPGKWVKEKDHLNPGDETDLKFSACPIPVRPKTSQPTLEELQLNAQSWREMEKFWTTVTVGGVLVGTVLTGGAFGAFGGGAAGATSSSGGWGLLPAFGL